MAKVSSGINQSLYSGALASSKSNGSAAPAQKVVPIENAEEEVQVNFMAPISFKDQLDQYVVTHQPALREKDCKTLKAFCVYVLREYMTAHP